MSKTFKDKKRTGGIQQIKRGGQHRLRKLQLVEEELEQELEEALVGRSNIRPPIR